MREPVICVHCGSLQHASQFGDKCPDCTCAHCKPAEQPPEVPCELDPVFGQCRRTDVHVCDVMCRRCGEPLGDGRTCPPEVPAPDEDMVNLYSVLAICKKADDDNATSEWIADEVRKLARVRRSRS